MGPVNGESSNPKIAAVQGESSVAGIGVRGIASGGGGMGVYGECAGGHGVHGKSAKGRGVVGMSDDYQGVYGHSFANSGVVGESDSMHAVFGNAKGPGASGVYGTNSAPGDTGPGVYGENPGGDGVVGSGRRGDVGTSDDFQGVYGHSQRGAGVVGESGEFDGVYGSSKNPKSAGVSGHNPGGTAGYFEGNVVVTGHIEFSGGDCAEHFTVAAGACATPGTVMVINAAGVLSPSAIPYDKRVAGVVSGAGFTPGIVLDKQDTLAERRPIALVGKVCCQVDAGYGSIEVGDLLTTSPTPGHAMKADDAMRAFGAVLGKALQPLTAGTGLLPILVALT
jgi:hypothetical protein